MASSLFKFSRLSLLRRGVAYKSTNAAENQPAVSSQSTPAPAPDSHTPENMSEKLGSLSKYLVYRYSSKKYASTQAVPDHVPTHELYNARDKGRATMMVILVGFTVLGSALAGYIGKKLHQQGHKHTDNIIKQHSEYSKIHQEMAKTMINHNEK